MVKCLLSVSPLSLLVTEGRDEGISEQTGEFYLTPVCQKEE